MWWFLLAAIVWMSGELDDEINAVFRIFFKGLFNLIFALLFWAFVIAALI